MAFLPPVVMEIRAQAAQFYAETAKVAEATKAMADETTAAADGMGTKVAASTARMGEQVVAETSAMGSETVARAEAMARAVVAETDQMSAGAATATEGMAAKVSASFEEMSAAAMAAAERTAASGKMTEQQLAKVAAQQEILANRVAVSAAQREAAEARAAKAAQTGATETEAAGIKMQSSFERTALSAVSSMGTVSGAFASATATQVKAAQGAEASFMGVANGITKIVGVSALVIAGVGLDMAAHFQKSTNLLVTAGGEAKTNLEYVRQGILNVSTATGTSAEQLSDGMYVMEKAGYRGAAGLAALQASAEGAKAENVDLATMTQATTDILLDYGYKMNTAKEATASSVSVVNQLVAASGAAKTTMQDFAASMAAVVPIASSAHISFAEVGGALATMTQHGQTAQQSSQNLANLIQSLIKPNNLAAASMQQMGIDTIGLAQHLGDTGLSGALKTVHDAVISHMGPDGLVIQGAMKDSANATRDLKTMIAQMPPELAQLSQGLLNGTEDIGGYTKAYKTFGGSAGAVGSQFLSLYKSSQGVNDTLKSGSAQMMTYQAAMTKVLGNVTAARAATMLLMNNSDDLNRSIQLVSDAAQQSGDHISTWADTQQTLSVQLDQAKQRSENLAIEIGTKLIPAANGALSGFADLFHGFEQGNPVLMTAAGIIGGIVTLAVANYTAKMIEAGIATTSRMIDMGASAITMSVQFVRGMMTSEVAVGQFSTKAEIAGAKVKSALGPALGAATVAGLALGGAFEILGAAQDKFGTNNTAPKVDQISKALADYSNTASKAGKIEVDNLFSRWDSGALKEAPQNVNSLDDAIKKVTHEGFDDSMNKIGDAISTAFGRGNTSSISQVEDRLKGFGDQLGEMVRGGSLQAAATDFNQLAASYEKNGKSAQQALDAMPGYKQALIDQAAAAGETLPPQELLDLAMGKVPDSMKTAANATQTYTDASGRLRDVTPEMQKALDDAGVSIDGQITGLDKLYDAVNKVATGNLDARDAEFRFGDAVRTATSTADALRAKLGGDMSSALNQNASDFNKSTDAGKQAEDQFSSVARAGLQTASVMSHDVTKGAADVDKSLTDTYNNMVTTAKGFGMGKDSAEALARSVLNVPPGVDIKTFMDDKAKQMAQDTKKAVDDIPPSKTINLYTVEHIQQVRDSGDTATANAESTANQYAQGNMYSSKATGGPVGYAMGGFARSYAAGGSPYLDVTPGGLLHGPGTALSDSINARLAKGEFVVNAEKTSKYGVPFLNSVNDGTFDPKALAKASIGPMAPVQVPQLPYRQQGPQVTNNRTVHNNVTVSIAASDPHRQAAELGNALQLMS